MNPQVEITQLGNAVLRQQAQIVTDSNSLHTTEMIEQMLAVLSDSQGVGLAAPQIGHSVCVIIVGSKPTSRYPNAPVMEPVVMINPSFQSLSDAQEKDWEGCLSIPGIRALVPRYTKIKVNFTDANGEQKNLELNGFVARIFQHEYDHLQGMVYLDRVENNRDIIAESEFLKLLVA